MAWSEEITVFLGTLTLLPTPVAPMMAFVGVSCLLPLCAPRNLLLSSPKLNSGFLKNQEPHKMNANEDV